MFYLLYQMTWTLSRANLLIQMMPQGTRFMAPLHGILPRHNLIYATSICTYMPLGYPTISQSSHDTAAAPICFPFMDQLFIANTIIDIICFVLVTFFDSIQPIICYWIQIIVSKLILLTVSGLIWLSFPQLNLNAGTYTFFLNPYHSSPSIFKLQALPQRSECPTNNSTVISWNIPGYWKLKLFWWGHCSFWKLVKRQKEKDPSLIQCNYLDISNK